MNDNLFSELESAHLEFLDKHYTAAESKYISILQEYPNSSTAWCGLGLVKYRLLLFNSDLTIDQIFDCFKRAKEGNRETPIDVDDFVLRKSLEMIHILHAYYFSDNEKIDSNEQYILVLIEQIKTHVLLFIQSHSELNNFKDSVANYETEIKNGITQKQSKITNSNSNIRKQLLRQARYDKLIRKAKNWKQFSYFCFLLCLVPVIALISGEYLASLSVIFWIAIGVYSWNRYKKLSDEADELQYNKA
ncbi:hypothetical protein ACTJJ0_15735 [Chitinophaga sp. 22321]|uniref:Uncharacterized protein n=1 Tax=Chitinophaga hostae TaxID=2831022 RepID=A0ABS5J2N9_9BACT|nr:hypothetical protein [Chitinophaga hostae]MBS0029474.1 hypothetical protein [Chitinophaga hostae]